MIDVEFIGAPAFSATVTDAGFVYLALFAAKRGGRGTWHIAA